MVSVWVKIIMSIMTGINYQPDRWYVVIGDIWYSETSALLSYRHNFMAEWIRP